MTLNEQLSPKCFIRILRSSGRWLENESEDLSLIINAWKDQQFLEPFTILHIGFDFPDNLDLNDLAVQFPRRILLTASARFGLPNRLADGAVSIQGYDDPPLYLAGPAWRVDPKNLSEQDREVWLAGQLLHTREFVQLASAPPDPYVSQHSSDRMLEMLRKLLPTIPQWMWDLELRTLIISPRTLSAMRGGKVASVGDLLSFTPEYLVALRNFGIKSAVELIEAIASECQEALSTNSIPDLVFNSAPQVHTLHAEPVEQGEAAVATSSDVNGLMDSFLNTVSHRDSKVLALRFGVDTRVHTLGEIGDQLKVSRERIRQIETDLIKKFTLNDDRIRSLADRTQMLFEAVSTPIPLSGTHLIDRWFVGLDRYWGFVSQALVAKGFHFHAIEINGMQHISRVSRDDLQQLVLNTKAFLEDVSMVGISRDECFAMVNATIPNNASEFRDYIWEQATKHVYFAIVNGTDQLVGAGRGANVAALAALQASDEKLHFTTLQQRVKHLFNREWDVRRIQNAAMEVAILLGRGTYGLRHHIPFSDEQLNEFALEARDIAVSAENPSRQWHARELLDALELSGQVEEGELDEYQLGYALRTTGAMQDLKRMVWSLDPKARGSSSRVDRYQAILAILEAAERPLSMAEIRKRIEEHRGIGEMFQIWPDEGIIRIDRNVWGLNPRDAVIPHHQQSLAMDRLVSVLNQKLSGIHISEIGSLFPEVSNDPRLGHLLLSLAHIHPSLSVARGNVVYMADWGEPRRVTMRQAVIQVLQEAKRPVTVDQIHRLVIDLIERPIDRTAIYGALNQFGLYVDGQGWTLAEDGTSV